MIVALYILIAMVVVGAALYIHFRLTGGQPSADPPDSPAPQADAEECCGMHITCERDSLMSSMSDTIEYYDDEELDRFRGRATDQYDDAEIEEFRSVLLTLLPDDIAGWGRSIQLRGIELPAPVREELLMIVADIRESRATKY
ncbi:MAG: phospholipase [Paramuribaculum sp.]|nr:phospholipase [Paramuribaculum sp.]